VAPVVVVVVVAYECSTQRLELRLWPEMERLALKSADQKEVNDSALNRRAKPGRGKCSAEEHSDLLVVIFWWF